MSARGCASCRKPRPVKGAWRAGWARSYCGTCYGRWRRHGFPPGGPPAPAPRAPRASRIARIEDYLDLRAWDVPDSEAAVRLGVSTRTLDRYKRQLRETAGAS